MTSELSLDKSQAAIRNMFSGVAPRYDLLNHLLSASLDRFWRRRAARAVDRSAPPGPVLDLCCGTGDQAVALAAVGRAVIAADFCLPMLARAADKMSVTSGRPAPLTLSDALAPPFRPASFAAVTIAFGVRNVADLDTALTAVHELLAPGGRLVVLEFAMPRSPLLGALYGAYFRHVLPLVARLVSGRGAAYEYLRDSVLDFPQREAFVARLADAGFAEPAWRDLSGGCVCLYSATRSAEPEAMEVG